MPDFIPPILVPPGVSDQRDRDFVAALSALLGEFRPADMVIQDAYTVPAELLPVMVIEAGLTEFVSPGMREDLLRALIAEAPAIHAQTGTIAGVKRALAAIGIDAQWTQWFQDEPRGPHDTHKVFLFVADTVIAGEEPLAAANQAAARRIVDATKRWSQDVAVSYGVRCQAPVYMGALARSAISATAHPFAFDVPVLRATNHVGATAASLLSITARYFGAPPPGPGAVALLEGEDGFAFDFTDGSFASRDTTGAETLLGEDIGFAIDLTDGSFAMRPS